MKNIMATIPKGRFKDWKTAEEIVKRCDGETVYEGKTWWWTLRLVHLPKEQVVGALCYMVFDGVIRGYFDIVDTDLASNWEWHGERGQDGHVLVLANWHPVYDAIERKGFQGWRYTALRP